ncbi:MAG: hypothetical protein KDD33_12565 [Bdellovibrionales bacterium]|nr:hypothetical protein [Bdellovibrionales bacterium]
MISHSSEVTQVDGIDPSVETAPTPSTLPFMMACKNREVKTPPYSPFIDIKLKGQNLDQKESDRLKFVEFIDGLLKDIHKTSLEQNRAAKEISQCLIHQKYSPRCPAIKSWIKNEAPDIIKDARFCLGSSTAAFKKAMAINIGFASTEPNSKLTVPAGEDFKTVPWSPLNRSEKAEIKKFLKYEKDIIESSVKHHQTPNSRNLTYQQRTWVSDQLRLKRDLQYAEYARIMSSYPILNHISDPNPSAKAWVYAGEQALKGNQKELQHISKLQGLLAKNTKAESLPYDLLAVTQYTAHIEAFLLKNPQYCEIASSMIKTAKARQTGIAYARNLPVIAASFYLSAGMAAVLGASAATADIVESDIKANSYSQQISGQVMNPTELALLQEKEDSIKKYSDETQQMNQLWYEKGAQRAAAQSRQTRNEFILTLPLEASGLGLVSKSRKWLRSLRPMPRANP